MPSFGGVTEMALSAVEPPVATLVQDTPSSDHSSQLWSAVGGVTVNVPGWPAPLTHWPVG